MAYYPSAEQLAETREVAFQLAFAVHMYLSATSITKAELAKELGLPQSVLDPLASKGDRDFRASSKEG